jgi:cell division protein FtsA
VSSNILAAIDVGSSKVCTLVAEVTSDRDLRILGVGITPSQGVKKGMVDNIQQASEAIATSVERAERSSGSRILSAHISIGGNHTESFNNRGIATIPGEERPITEVEIERGMEGARNLNLPTNREILHEVARYFVVDGQEHVSDPIGMFGQRLDVDVHIISGGVTAIQNLSQCIESSGVEIENLVFSPLAAADAVLEEEEREQGVVLVDIGGGTTDIAVFVEGAIFHTAVLPVGGQHLTRDLVAGLKAPFSSVENLKVKHGSALPSRVDGDEMVQVEAFGGEGAKEVSRRKIAEILQARVEEILEMVYLDVRRAGFDEMIAAGIVLCGGTSELHGIAELSELVLRMPVRVGVPRGVHGLSDSLNSPAYGTSVGLLRWAMEENRHDSNGRKSDFHLPTLEMTGMFESARKWLGTLVPK